MTRDEMIALVARIHDEHDEMGRLMADSGNSTLLAIHARMGRHLHAVITALTAEAPSAEMPTIEPWDVIKFAHGNDAPLLQQLSHPAALEDWNGKLGARVLAVYRAIWRREVPRG